MVSRRTGQKDSVSRRTLKDKSAMNESLISRVHGHRIQWTWIEALAGDFGKPERPVHDAEFDWASALDEEFQFNAVGWKIREGIGPFSFCVPAHRRGCGKRPAVDGGLQHCVIWDSDEKRAGNAL
jgi:hypothetical protein